MKVGDEVRNHKYKHLGGVVGKIDGRYVEVINSAGGVSVYRADFLECGKTKPEAPPPDFQLSSDGLSPEAAQFRDQCIQQYQATHKHDLWVKGGSVEQFIGFGQFLKWLDGHRRA